MRTMHLFAGAGGGLLADLILGHEPVVAIEWDGYACQVLRERVADGWFPNMRVHEGDVRLFDSSEYKGKVDCIHAGFPCQDISNAGNKAGVGEGTRSGLYREVLRIADEIRPEYIFLENVAAIVNGDDGRMLRTVVGDLAERGFDAVWQCLSASQVGAAHKRDRWWLLAFPSSGRCRSRGNNREERHIQNNKERKPSEVQRQGNERKLGAGKACAVLSKKKLANADSERCVHRQFEKQPAERREYAQRDASTGSDDVSNTNITHGKRNECTKRSEQESTKHERDVRRQAKSNMGGMVDDMAYRVDVYDWVQEEAQVGRVTDETENRANRLKALGNGQVPLQAAAAFSILWEMMEGIKND